MSTLFLVHAHPDDESISTGGVMIKAHEEGGRVVLVTCTRGEAGEIHNMDEESTRPRLAEVRTEELRRACAILGVDRLEFLGYRDSGMAGTLDNENSESFHKAPLNEAAERLAALLREERPEVVVTENVDGFYGHPDHIKAHQVTVAALDLLEREGWRPAKLYFTGAPKGALQELVDRYREDGVVNAWVGEDGKVLFGRPDEEITTAVDVRELVERKKAAFAVHRSQVAPDSFFLNTPSEMFETAFGTEHFVLARGALGSSDESREPDLFAGL